MPVIGDTIVESDWTVERSTGAIRYIGDSHLSNGGTDASYAPVIKFHRWLQDLADDAVASGDDELDITNENPSARSTDNIITLLGNYNIDDLASQHLYDGSIIQGDTIYDGIVNFGNLDVAIQIIQNGSVIADDWWNVGDSTVNGVNGDTNAGISHRFMLKTRSAGVNIDGRRILGTCRRFGYTYSEFLINGSARGNNVLALSDAADLNNETAILTVDGWTGITNTHQGYRGIDIDNSGDSEYYYSEWDTNQPTRTINNFYERMKFLTRDVANESALVKGDSFGGDSIYGLPGELFRGITHEIPVDGPSGTFGDVEAVSWSTGGAAGTPGTGQLIAINSTTNPTKLWIQLLTGVSPIDGDSINGDSSGAKCIVNGIVTDRAPLITTPFIGASTGSAIIGGYGVGIEYDDLTQNDKLFDLDNTQVTPPNLVTNTVSGLVAGEDRLLIAPWDGSSTDAEGNPAINKNQYLLSTALTTDNVTWVTVKDGDSTAIMSDTPSAGFIRVIDDLGFERRLHYSSWTTGDTFIIDTTDGNEDFSGNEAAVDNYVYTAYGDTLAGDSVFSYSGVYDTDRTLVVVVRDGDTTPIKEFISSWSFTSNAGSISVIRTTDA